MLDPGLSFGTGNHPTTAFCLRALADARRPGSKQAFLDIGTGSGILAIAAAKLGYAPVRAVDFDPEAVRIARENARRNRVQISITRRDITQWPAREGRENYGVVCANLTADLLLAESKQIVARLQPDGRLVLAGILRGQFPEIEKAYRRLGLRLAQGAVVNEWWSGMFAVGGITDRRRK